MVFIRYAIGTLDRPDVTFSERCLVTLGSPTFPSPPPQGGVNYQVRRHFFYPLLLPKLLLLVLSLSHLLPMHQLLPANRLSSLCLCFFPTLDLKNSDQSNHLRVVSTTKPVTSATKVATSSSKSTSKFVHSCLKIRFSRIGSTGKGILRPIRKGSPPLFWCWVPMLSAIVLQTQHLPFFAPYSPSSLQLSVNKHLPLSLTHPLQPSHQSFERCNLERKERLVLVLKVLYSFWWKESM